MLEKSSALSLVIILLSLSMILSDLIGNSLQNPQAYKYARHLHEPHKGWTWQLRMSGAAC